MKLITSKLKKIVDKLRNQPEQIVGDISILKVSFDDARFARRFGNSIDIPLLTSLSDAVRDFFYPIGELSKNIRSITVIFKHLDGVGYTTGSDTKKSIFVSTDYLLKKGNDNNIYQEACGVIVHELVHVWQYDGSQTVPTGLLEGIADYVRLVQGYAPPHWLKRRPAKWDAGYEHTAFFLDWITRTYNPHFIQELNKIVFKDFYHHRIFEQLTGKTLHQLYEEYLRTFEF